MVPRLLAVALCCGCATVVPMQTASTVPRGSLAAGGQISVTPWCSLGLEPACPEMPDGAPTPEVRTSARLGVLDGVDLGSSLHADLVLGEGVQFGIYVDGKAEVLSLALGGDNREIVSVGAAVGVTRAQPVGGPLGNEFSRGQGVTHLDLVLPVFLGHQWDGVEVTLSPRLAERRTFGGSLRPLWIPSFGLALSAFTRGVTRFGAQLGYHAPFSLPGDGAWSLGVGFFHVFGPK